jgi:branched-chain amino acid transport system permease protein
MRVKLTAFAVSSAFVTMAGGLLGYYLTARESTSYSIVDTLNYASMVVVGGLSSAGGVVLGALFFYAFPVIADWALDNVPIISDIEFLRIHQSALQLGVFGVATIIVLVFFPEGLIGIVRRLDAWTRRAFRRRKMPES